MTPLPMPSMSDDCATLIINTAHIYTFFDHFTHLRKGARERVRQTTVNELCDVGVARFVSLLGLRNCDQGSATQVFCSTLINEVEKTVLKII